MASFAARVVAAGASGLVLFNRFYQPDLDLKRWTWISKVELSRTWELRLPLRWIAILRPELGPGTLARRHVRDPHRVRRRKGSRRRILTWP